MFIGMSACLDGAVAGDHCSPISDTTIMSSAGAQCDHLSHVSTQLPYVITVSAVSFVAFLLAGFVQNWFVVFPLALVALWVVLYIMKKRSDRRQPEAE
jgi:Na+/H+ antiporter NhaC